MKKNSAVLVTAVVVCIIVLGVVLSIYVTSYGYGNNRPSIVLPNKADDTLMLPMEITQANKKIINEAKFTPKNVKGLLKTLNRPSEYTFESQTIIHYGEKQKVQTAKGVVKGDVANINLENSGGDSYTFIISADTVYTWKTGQQNVKKTAKGIWSYDDLAKMPTYEELMNEDSGEVKNVTVSSLDGEPSVELELENAITGVVDKYVICSSTGLLKSFKSFDGDVCVLETSIKAVEVRAVSSDEFKLPSGAVVG